MRIVVDLIETVRIFQRHLLFQTNLELRRDVLEGSIEVGFSLWSPFVAILYVSLPATDTDEAGLRDAHPEEGRERGLAGQRDCCSRLTAARTFPSSGQQHVDDREGNSGRGRFRLRPASVARRPSDRRTTQAMPATTANDGDIPNALGIHLVGSRYHWPVSSGVLVGVPRVRMSIFALTYPSRTATKSRIG